MKHILAIHKSDFKEWDGYIHSIQQKEEIILFNSSKIYAIFEKNKNFIQLIFQHLT